MVTSRASTSEAGSTVLAALLGAKEAVDALSDFVPLNDRCDGSSGSVRQRRKLRLELCWQGPSKWMKVFFTGRESPFVGLPTFDGVANSSMQAFVAMLDASTTAFMKDAG